VGDGYRIQQVLSALVTNALWYTPPNTEVVLEATATKRHVTVTVADNGPGLAPDDAARVFDRFYRGDQSRARRTGGSGLGLAIAKSIVDAHHGTISLDTQPGAGCRFTVTLPKAQPDGEG
jgi:two-component system OmpR family sensor kinase